MIDQVERKAASGLCSRHRDRPAVAWIRETRPSGYGSTVYSERSACAACADHADTALTERGER